MPTFDLIEEPWIPCETVDGRVVERGLRDVLLGGHALRAVQDESPLTTAMLHRLLIVVVSRAYQLRTRDEWFALWRAPSLPPGPLESYLARWSQRFDLFHEERPFLQVAKLEESMAAANRVPERTLAWRLAIETSSCGGHIHLFAQVPTDRSLPPARAARALLAFQGFTNGGRIQNEAESWRGGMARGGCLVILRGASVRETLLLNTGWRDRRSSEDVPPWERDRSIERVVRPIAGDDDLLVWPARRVQLVATTSNGQTAVDEVVTAAGERPTEEGRDPQMAYTVRDPKKPFMAVRFDPDRSPWRDANALFRVATEGGFQRPRAIDRLAELSAVDPSLRARRFDAMLLGAATDNARVLLARSESLPLPQRLLEDVDAVDALENALGFAEQAARVLSEGLWTLCSIELGREVRDVPAKDVRALLDGLGILPGFWAAVGECFGRWLRELDIVDDPDAHVEVWRVLVAREARRGLDRGVARLGVDARALRAIAASERRFHLALAALFPRPPAETGAEGVSA